MPVCANNTLDLYESGPKQGLIRSQTHYYIVLSIAGAAS